METHPNSTQGMINRFEQLSEGAAVEVETADGKTVSGTLQPCSVDFDWALDAGDDLGGSDWRMTVITDPEGGPLGVFLTRASLERRHEVSSLTAN